MKSYLVYTFIFFMTISALPANAKYYDLRKYGLQANTTQNTVPLLADAIREIVHEHQGDSPIVLRFAKGIYHFYPATAQEREYYISNHDQNNPKNVGIPLEQLQDIVLDGQGSKFIFHGRMLPLSLIDCQNCTLKNFSIDFENPHVIQFKVIANDTLTGEITLEVAPWVKYKVENGTFIAFGEGWQHTLQSCIAFDENNRHIVFNTSDIETNFRQVREKSPRLIVASNWKQPKLLPGTVIAGRTWHRPAPSIFIHHSRNTQLKNIQVHYAEGMGLLAQLCENITLDHFSVCLKGKNDPRYFTTQADATHFSACKGTIVSKNGLYENMMDDAINIHGTYLKVTEKQDDYTLVAKYMHSQSWGFEWGYPGDTVQFIQSRTMEITGNKNTIASIVATDRQTPHGAKQFKIRFTQPLPETWKSGETIGIENLSWTPEVEFTHNTIRNNRARGTLFSTPQKTLVAHNLFDHTSGTAILLCGDCNGWYETGACREITIRKNRFKNALTNLFQFTNAVISIYPEIPDLAGQQKHFHGGEGIIRIVIENNTFETFDKPILYAKSVNGLIFKNNTIKHNQDFPAFHWNRHPFFFEKASRIIIQNNTFDYPFQAEQDIRLHLTSKHEIYIK